MSAAEAKEWVMSLPIRFDVVWQRPADKFPLYLNSVTYRKWPTGSTTYKNAEFIMRKWYPTNHMRIEMRIGK